MPEIMQERPPFVTFEVRAEEDRQASIDAGHYVTKDVDYALITPAGSKDRVERVASEWFVYLARQVDEGRFPAAWLDAFKSKYEAWKKGQEVPVSGTSVRQWNVLSPSQCKNLLDLHILTIEDLAAANEESLARLGMGGRDLQRRAREWLAASGDVGKVSERASALAAENEALKSRVAAMEAQIAQIAAAQTAPGRPTARAA